MHSRNDNSSATEIKGLGQIDPGEEARLYSLVLEHDGAQHTLANLISVRRASPEKVWDVWMEPGKEYWDVVQSTVEKILPHADKLVLQAKEGDTWLTIHPPPKQGTVHSIAQKPMWGLDITVIPGSYQLMSAERDIIISFDVSSGTLTVYWTFDQNLPNFIHVEAGHHLTLSAPAELDKDRKYNAASSTLHLI